MVQACGLTGSTLRMLRADGCHLLSGDVAQVNHSHLRVRASYAVLDELAPRSTHSSFANLRVQSENNFCMFQLEQWLTPRMRWKTKLLENAS